MKLPTQTKISAKTGTPSTASARRASSSTQFPAGIRKGLDQIERGETVPHEEVKRQLATWLTK
jgi:predicted transcriptional regulator